MPNPARPDQIFVDSGIFQVTLTESDDFKDGLAGLGPQCLKKMYFDLFPALIMQL